MQSKRFRVVLGSDGAQARDILSGLVEKQSGVVVGQAENAIEAITLTRNLRPDVVILDCCLPHTLGLKHLPSSRAGGLDAAQYISREIPNARVLLVDNLDAAPSFDSISTPAVALSLYEDKGAVARPLELSNLPAAGVGAPIFTRLLAGRLASRGWYARLAEQAMLVGTGGILFGLMMMVTGLLFIPGVFLALLGGVAAGLGFVTRIILRYFFKQENG